MTMKTKLFVGDVLCLYRLESLCTEKQQTVSECNKNFSEKVRCKEPQRRLMKITDVHKKKRDKKFKKRVL